MSTQVELDERAFEIARARRDGKNHSWSLPEIQRMCGLVGIPTPAMYYKYLVVESLEGAKYGLTLQGYQPIGKVNTGTAVFERFFAAVPEVHLEWESVVGEKRDGTPIIKRLGQDGFLRKYGIRATKHAYSYDISVGRYNVEEDQLILPAGLLRTDISAKYDAGVEAWLNALGGVDGNGKPNHEMLLDWLATFTDRKAGLMPGIALIGDGGCGKGVLHTACATFYGGQSTPYKHFAARFASTMRESPLVHLDEGFKDDRGARSVDDVFNDFKERVVAGSHKLEMKGVDGLIPLHGHIRLIVSVNNLSDFTKGILITDSNVAALTRRLSFHDCTKGPAVKLAHAIGIVQGNPDVPSIIEGRIVPHIQWLVETRRAAAAARAPDFVRGGGTPGFAAMLLRRDARTTEAAKFLIEFLENARADREWSPDCFVKGGEVYVKSGALARGGSLNTAGARTALKRQSDVISAVRGLSLDPDSRQVHGLGRFWRIDEPLLLAAAAELDQDTDMLKERIKALEMS